MADALLTEERCLDDVFYLRCELGSSNPLAYQLVINMIAALQGLDINNPLKIDGWISGQPLVHFPLTLEEANLAEEAIIYTRMHLAMTKRPFFSSCCQFIVSYSRHALPKSEHSMDFDNKIGFSCFLRNKKLSIDARTHLEEDQTLYKNRLVESGQELITREQFVLRFGEVTKLISTRSVLAGNINIESMIALCESNIEHHHLMNLQDNILSLSLLVRGRGESFNLIRKIEGLAVLASNLR